MACIVLSDKTGVSKSLTDKEIIRLLAGLNQHTGRQWECEEYQWTVRRLFRKPRLIKTYDLYLECHGEWQVISFHSSIYHDIYRIAESNKHNGPWMIYGADAGAVFAYMQGYLNGLDK